jgi:uncharacterized protein YggU (UPF0235/DUF167 family)
LAGKSHEATPRGLRLVLRVTPNAPSDRIEGVERRDDGSEAIRVRVRAVPDKGRANAAVVALIAKALEVPKSAVAVVSGETARLKTVLVSGDAATLAERLGGLLR